MADAYRALGFAVQQDVELGGQQIDVLAEKVVGGIGHERLAVECKDESRPVSNQTVQDYAATLVALMSSRVVTRGAIVSANGFSTRAKNVAKDIQHLELFSWDELTRQIFDVTAGLRGQVRDYEAREIFHNYVDVRAERLSWDTQSLDSEDRITSLSHVLASAAAVGNDHPDAGRAFIIMGDYGAGKTTLMRRVQYELAAAYDAGTSVRIPLYVALRDFGQTGDVTALLRATLRDQLFLDVPTELLWERINSGVFAILLDGFDEMAERSDEIRRRNLFRALLPILTAPSMAVVTTRPSFLVGHGELDALLDFLRAREETVSGTRGRPGGPVERLTQALVEKNREARPGVGALITPPPGAVSVLRLLPLDWEQIVDYVESWSPVIKTRVGLETAEVIDFIDKTYDLYDLATRPLLLKLIVDTIIDGDLNLRDETLQLGPSGLYEAYTTAKLRFDIAKGEIREGGLPMEVRRELAEIAAMKMHEEETLELNLLDVIRHARSESEAMALGFSNSRLTEDEIATDFATCSFVTVRDGACRFIHKSFREFFVARVLETRIGSSHPTFRTKLEQEVLYFLGGFAPTHEDLESQLWDAFDRTSKLDEEILARNLICAYLYTGPEHKKRVINNALISDVKYRKLKFLTCTMAGGTAFTGCEMEDLSFVNSTLDGLLFDGSRIGSLDLSGTKARLTFAETLVNRLSVDEKSTSISLHSGSVVEEMSANNAAVDLSASRSSDGGDEIDVHRLWASKSWVRLGRGGSSAETGSSTPAVLGLAAEECVVLCGTNQCLRSTAGTRGTLFVLHGSGRADFLRDCRDELTVVIASSSSEENEFSAVDGLPCGAFDFKYSGTGLGRAPTCWGIATVTDQFLERAGVKQGEHDGVRLGNVYFVDPSWYAAQTAEDGWLSAVFKLRGLASARDTEAGIEDVGLVLAALREQHADLATAGFWLPPGS